jgi:anthranilate phosphoribosyltransferase
VRAALGVRTVFNVLGPLCNPAAPPFLVLGAYQLEVAELMAQALLGSGVERAFVIHGAEGWDEPTPLGPFVLFDVTPEGVRQERRAPADYGFSPCSAAELTGGDAQYNADELARALRGEVQGAHRDALLLGAALALEVSGREPAVSRGVQRAAQAIDSGAAARLLERLAQFGRSQLASQAVRTP